MPDQFVRLVDWNDQAYGRIFWNRTQPQFFRYDNAVIESGVDIFHESAVKHIDAFPLRSGKLSPRPAEMRIRGHFRQLRLQIARVWLERQERLSLAWITNPQCRYGFSSRGNK